MTLLCGRLFAVFCCLGFMVVAQGVRAQTAGLPPDTVKKDLQRILSGPDFAPHVGTHPIQDSIKSTVEPIYNRFVRPLIRMIGKLWRSLLRLLIGSGLGLPSVGSPFAANLFVVLVAVAGIALVVWVVRQWPRRKRAKRADNIVASPVLFDEPLELLEADEWLRRAVTFAEKGNWRSAVRCTFLAAVMQLDSHGVVPYSRHATNGEMLQSVRKVGPGALPDSFLELTTGYESAWYGTRTCTAAQYSAFSTRFNALRQALADMSAPSSLPMGPA